MNSRIVGGIHPKTHWESPLGEAGTPWVEFHPPRIHMPMCQGDEEPCRPLVAVGDRVKINQRIGEASDTRSVHIHSGISGTVSSIRDEVNPASGKTETVVVVERDDTGETDPPRGLGDAATPDAKTLGAILRDAGVIGMGGAGFPSHAKLEARAAINVLLVNGAECEPGIAADAVLMRERAADILDGCGLVMAALGIPEAIIGIESNKPGALARITALAGRRANMRVESLPRIYPMGGEKQLILRLTGREVPAGKLPSDVGAMVFNVATLAAVADAVRRGQPLTHRICSVVGDVAKAQNVRFPIGTRAGDLIDFCGGWLGEPGRLVLGGPMMGQASGSGNVPLVKSSNALLLINRHHAETPSERPCIRCNRCSAACPMRLMPQFLNTAGKREDWGECDRLSASSCINCGCCSYVCPAFIPLAANITQTARKLKSMKEGK